MKMLTVVTPTVERNWKNLNISPYIMCIIIHSGSLFIEFHVVHRNDKLGDWMVTRKMQGRI